jgi:hypothetical protein
MDDRKRLHRVDPKRTGPVRNLSTLWQPSPTSNGLDPSNRNRDSNEEIPSPKADGDPLTQGVSLAYRVIEKYINEGRRTAEQFSKHSNDAKMPSDSIRILIDRIFRFQSEIFPVWIDALGTLAQPDKSTGAYAANRSYHAEANDASRNGPQQRSGVSIELTSSQRARVSLDLRTDVEGRSLMTHGLHAVDPGKPPLTDITFVPGENHSNGTLRISIPELQPSGIYSGVIVDRKKGETWGTLSVQIPD